MLENYRTRLAKTLQGQRNTVGSLRSLITETFAASVTVADELIGTDYKLVAFSDDGGEHCCPRAEIKLGHVRSFVRHVTSAALGVDWLSLGFELPASDGYFVILYLNIARVDERGIALTFGRSKELELEIGGWTPANAERSRAKLLEAMKEGFEEAADRNWDPDAARALAFLNFKSVATDARPARGDAPTRQIGFRLADE